MAIVLSLCLPSSVLQSVCLLLTAAVAMEMGADSHMPSVFCQILINPDR